MDNWDEIRTAYQVARMGTVSGAADVLGVHHATVIRHIDALESALGVKLFQRHARGYTATEAGQDLLQVAQTTDDQFNQLSARLKGRGDDISGELTVTSLTGLSKILTPSLVAFQVQHPGLRVRYLTGARLFRLEYGEAHVAIRAGTAPDQPDNVVQNFGSSKMVLAASKQYVERHGMPASEDDLKNHWFVGHDRADSKAPFNRWLRKMVDDDRIIFRTLDNGPMAHAIAAGAGIGFVPNWALCRNKDLVEVIPSKPDWETPFWLVTHMDLHRTPKVQAFLTFLKEDAKSWEM